MQIGNIRQAFGVEPLTDWDESVPPDQYGRTPKIERFKRDLTEFIEEWSA